MTKTITVQIGNSDDHLAQKEWSWYFRAIDMEIRARSRKVHFCGTSPSDSEWQNACWVFESEEYDIPLLKTMLHRAADTFHQDSVAWLEGNVEFL